MKKRPVGDDIYERDAQGIVCEKPEARKKPGHHTGPRGEYGGSGYGYILNADGSYSLAPGQKDNFDSIHSEIMTIHNLVDHVMVHAQERLRKLEQRKLNWFKEVCQTVYREGDVNNASYTIGTGQLTFKNDVSAPPRNKALKDRIEEDKAGAGKTCGDRPDPPEVKD